MHSKQAGRADLATLMGIGARVLLVGAPGCAKTARIQAAGKETGRRVVVSRVSLTDRLDWSGALVPDVAAGLARVLPLAMLQDLRTTRVPTLLFLDDLGQAPIDAQAAVMQLWDEGGLSDQVLIWAATNRPGDKAGVTSLCEPLRSRFDCAFSIPTPGVVDSVEGAVQLGTWGEEVAGWVSWAMDHADAPAEVVAWHRSTEGRTLYQWKPSSDPAVRMADYRSWGTLIRFWNAGVRDFSTIAGVVGKSVAGEFLAFARLANDLPSPDAVFMDPANALVPSEPASCYLIASMLVARAEAKHGRACVVYLERLPRVYGALLARDLLHKLGNGLAGCAEWVRWFNANQELFA